MQKILILFIIVLPIFLNIVASKAEASPEKKILVAIMYKIEESLDEMSEVLTSFKFERLPGLIKIVEMKIIIFDEAFSSLSPQEKILLMDNYIEARGKYLSALNSARNLMKTIGPIIK